MMKKRLTVFNVKDIDVESIVRYCKSQRLKFTVREYHSLLTPTPDESQQ